MERLLVVERINADFGVGVQIVEWLLSQLGLLAEERVVGRLFRLVRLPARLQQVYPWRLRALIAETDGRSRLVRLVGHLVLYELRDLPRVGLLAANRPLLVHVFQKLSALAQTFRQTRLLLCLHILGLAGEVGEGSLGHSQVHLPVDLLSVLVRVDGVLPFWPEGLAFFEPSVRPLAL